MFSIDYDVFVFYSVHVMLNSVLLIVSLSKFKIKVKYGSEGCRISFEIRVVSIESTTSETIVIYFMYSND